MKISTFVMSALLVGAMAGKLALADESEVNLYSYRQPFLIQPMLDAFTKETGIKVNVVYAKKGMLERLKAEGENSPADAVLTADIGRLNDMVEAGVLQPVHSDALERNIPAQYRHPDGLWFGLTTRARVIFASRDRVGTEEVLTYEDLADPKLKGRVCTRSGKHVYMVSLIASVIAHAGEDKAEQWLRGVKDNLARKPQGNDRAQAKAIHEGICDVAVANTYYMGKMATNEDKPEQKAWAESLRIVFPNQDDRGTHVNVSGAAVTRSAGNRENAVRLLEFLSDDYAQELYAEQNFEYPVKAGVPLHPLVASWGDFKADTIGLADVAKYRAAASKMVDRVGYDQATGS
jgi:iron(III) transport system substrate-binding protein